jgi:hypothetical protein
MCGLRRVYDRLRWWEMVGHCNVHPVQRDTSALQMGTMGLVGLLNAIEQSKGRIFELLQLSRRSQSRGRQETGLGQRNGFPGLSPSNPGGGGTGRYSQTEKNYNLSTLGKRNQPVDHQKRPVD